MCGEVLRASYKGRSQFKYYSGKETVFIIKRFIIASTWFYSNTYILL